MKRLFIPIGSHKTISQESLGTVNTEGVEFFFTFYLLETIYEIGLSVLEDNNWEFKNHNNPILECLGSSVG